jgi:hypothetical protein
MDIVCDDYFKGFSLQELQDYTTKIGAKSLDNKHEIIASIMAKTLKIYSTVRITLRQAIFNSVYLILRKYNKGPINAETIKDFIDFMNLPPHRGREGSVYRGFINVQNVKVPIPLAIKYTKTTIKFINELASHKIQWYGLFLSPKKELLTSYMINEIINIGASPNLIYTYQQYRSKSCKETHKVTAKGEFIQTTSPCLITIMEGVDNDIRKVETRLSLSEWKCMLFQVIWSLYSMQKYWGLKHGDVAVRNIFYSVTGVEGHFEYRDENVVYYVPKNLRMFYLGDYGTATSDRYFGSSGGKIVGTRQRNLQTGTVDLPSSYDSILMQTDRDNSLEQLVADCIKHKAPVEIEEEILTPLKAMIKPQSKYYVGRILNYPEIIKALFFDLYSNKPATRRLAIYSILKPEENMDKIYKEICDEILSY